MTDEVIKLHGITFAELPHISKGDPVTIVREAGEPWDSEGYPAYSVRIEGLHIGYIPLPITLREEALKAREGLKKVWKHPYDTMTRDQLREIGRELSQRGELTQMRAWTQVGKDEMRKVAIDKMREAEHAEVVRDWLYVEIMRNNLTPHGVALPVFYDEKAGRNFDEIGEICSISIRIDMWGCTGNYSATEAKRLVQKAIDKDEWGETRW